MTGNKVKESSFEESRLDFYTKLYGVGSDSEKIVVDEFEYSIKGQDGEIKLEDANVYGG